MTIDTAINFRMIGYVLFMLSPFVCLFAKGLSRKPGLILRKYLASILIMFVVIVVPLENLNYQLDLVVHSLDRNGDGSVSPKEEATWTDEEKRANEMWGADGARNVFGYIVFPIFGAIYTAAIFSLLYAGYWLVGKFKNREGA